MLVSEEPGHPVEAKERPSSVTSGHGQRQGASEVHGIIVPAIGAWLERGAPPGHKPPPEAKCPCQALPFCARGEEWGKSTVL